MATATEIILLEKVDKLGQMGEIVKVKPGYARNFLLPQGKALRATKGNIAYFEAEKATLEATNKKKADEASKLAKKVDGKTIQLIRAASETGHLYGSVNSRDITEAVEAETGVKIERRQVEMNQNYKEIGLFDVTVQLHPEVKAVITLNIARTAEEAAEQQKLGRALIASEAEDMGEAVAANDSVKEELLDDEALEAEKAAEEAAAAAEAETAEATEAPVEEEAEEAKE